MNIQQVIHTLILSALFLGACQPAPSATAALTAPPVPTSTSTVPPPTPFPPVVYVGGHVPCFAGPNADQNIVSSLEIGESPEIQGQDSSGEYWIINRKDGKGYCWLESRYSTVVGSLDSIAVIMPTPTAIPPVPAAPKNPTSEVKCQISDWPYVVYIFLNWENLEGERGYRVYRDGNLLAELGQDEVHYTDSLTRDDGWGRNRSMLIPYQIEAFNETGTSEPAQVLVAFLCRL